MTTQPAYDAVVLCGGSSRRMGGVDKTSLVLRDLPLLDHVLAAVVGAQSTWCVGPRRPTSRPVQWCREQPAGGGPVAALAAALPHVTAPSVVLLAADLVALTPGAVALVVAAAGDRGAVLVDEDGREQWLAGCWPTEGLRAALGSRAGGPLHDVLSRLDAVRLALPGSPWWDCDTPADLERARASHG